MQTFYCSRFKNVSFLLFLALHYNKLNFSGFSMVVEMFGQSETLDAIVWACIKL